MKMVLAILLVGIGAVGGWYLRGLVESDSSLGLLSSPPYHRHESLLTTQSADSGTFAHKRLSYLLSTAQYPEAVEQFRTLVFNEGFEHVGWASELFFFHTQRLKQLGATHKAIRLLEEYIAVAPQDADAYILLAHLQRLEGRTSTALETLVSALKSVPSNRHEQLRREFNRMLRAYVNQHGENDSDPVDETLLERLVQEMPHYEPLYVELARRYIQIGNLDAASTWLQEVDPNGNQARQRERLQALIDRQLEQVTVDESSVALQRLGRHYTVDVTMIDGFNEADFRLMIDTGASLTLLTPEAAERLGIKAQQIEPRQQLTTPGGVVEAPLYQIEALAVGQEIVWDLPVVITPFETGEGLIDGLIGMDFLGKFNFKIDQDRQELKLKPRT